MSETITHFATNPRNSGNKPMVTSCGAEGVSTIYGWDVTCEACKATMGTGQLTFQRKGDSTTVLRGGVTIGWIVRKEGSDSSPRGRAYRTFHHPKTVYGSQLGRCYSRKEAVEALVAAADRRR